MLVGLTGCGGAPARHVSVASAPPPAPAAGAPPAFGLSEDNADLLWSPQDADAPAAARAFLSARRALTALHPRYLRLVIDWATFEPSASSPLQLATELDGCARGVAPCGAFAGVADELAAIASQQHAARAEGRPAGFQVVLDFFGVPAWAALAPHGCERPDTPPSARPIAESAIAGYRALIAALVTLAARAGVEAPWWSPWNEPNDPRFLSPQRASCSAEGAPLAPAVYARLASAMAAQLHAAGETPKMLLGELGGYETGSEHRLSIGEFVASLPAGVLCLGAVWTVHDYAARLGHPSTDPVAALEAALDSRGGCAASAPIWVTEVGAGAPEPGDPRAGGAAEEHEACLALAHELQGLDRDPRVQAVFQYTFRDDPDFPVGLDSADLTRLYPAYELWLSLGGQSARAPATAAPDDVCMPR